MKPATSFYIPVLVFVTFFFATPAVSSENNDLREKTNLFYREIIKMNTTGIMNIPRLLSLFDPKVKVVHPGPEIRELPFLKTFNPINGVPYSGFLRWAVNLVSASSVTTFVPERSDAFIELDIADHERYMVVDGNTVYSHVLEGGKLRRWNTLSLFDDASKRTEWSIENIHIFYFNTNGLIEKIVFISDTESFMNAVSGVSSSPDDLIDSQAKNIMVEEYPYGPWHNKGLSAAFIDILESGVLFDIQTLLAEDVVCEIPGNHPFAGRFSGINEIHDFIASISEQVVSFEITEMVSENNKAMVKCRMEGKNGITGETFTSDYTVFSFQFNSDGRITSIKAFFDTFAVSDTYR